MHHEDAVLLERIATATYNETGNKITIDLADLGLIDSEAAPILKRVAEHIDFSIDGMELFLQSIVDDAERQGS